MQWLITTTLEMLKSFNYLYDMFVWIRSFFKTSKPLRPTMVRISGGNVKKLQVHDNIVVGDADLLNTTDANVRDLSMSGNILANPKQ